MPLVNLCNALHQVVLQNISIKINFVCLSCQVNLNMHMPVCFAYIFYMPGLSIYHYFPSDNASNYVREESFRQMFLLFRRSEFHSCISSLVKLMVLHGRRVFDYSCIATVMLLKITPGISFRM